MITENLNDYAFKKKNAGIETIEFLGILAAVIGLLCLITGISSSIINKTPAALEKVQQESLYSNNDFVDGSGRRPSGSDDEMTVGKRNNANAEVAEAARSHTVTETIKSHILLIVFVGLIVALGANFILRGESGLHILKKKQSSEQET